MNILLNQMYTEYIHDIKDIINDLIDNTMRKYIIAAHVYPKRLTMISMIYCPICEKNNIDVSIISLNTWDGKFNNHGWISCNECINIINMAKQNYETKKNFILSYDYYNPELYISDINFWRISSNNKIKPYLETGFYNQYASDFFYIHLKKQRLYCQISWYKNKKIEFSRYNIYVKGVPFSNLIFHNREIFGYDVKYFYKKNNSIPFSNKFLKYFKNEYNISNTYSYSKNTFQLINDKYQNNEYYLPDEVKKIIYSYLFNVI